MKKLITITKMLVLFFCVQLSAQQTSIDALDEVYDAAEVIRVRAKSAKQALRTITVDYFVNNNTNPNTSVFLATILDDIGVVEEYSDEVLYFISQAEQLNPNIDGSEIAAWASAVEANEDIVSTKSFVFVDEIQNNNRSAARQQMRDIRDALNRIIALAKDIKTEAENLKSTPNNYNVRILLEDERTGAPVSPGTLPGYVATNVATGELIYPDPYSQETNVFANLPAGTYRFDAYDGYFDGASSQTVTLTDALVGADGFIIVTLRYWSE